MKNYSVHKNIKKNIPAYNTVSVDTAATFSKLLGRIFGIIIAVTLPLGMTLAGFNIAYKMPDIYGFDLSRTMTVNEVGYADDATLISELMADYLNHNTDTFILRAKMKDGSASSVFTQNDQNTMAKYRDALDTSFTAACVLLPLSFLGYLAIYLLGRKRALKYSLRASLVVYLATALGIASIMLTTSGSASFARRIIGVAPETGDVLPQLFGSGLQVEMYVLAIAVAAVALLLIFAFTMRLTHGSKIFNRSDE